MITYSTIEYGNEIYASLPSLPSFDGQVVVIPWMKHYSWTWLADIVYGDKSKSTDLMLLNGVLDPFQDMSNKNIRIPVDR